MKTIVSLKDVNFAYNDRPLVLEDINFEIYQNEFIGIIGPNGGGKSTLLKLIMGLLKPATGKITVFNKTPVASRKAIGYVPQFTTFNREFPISVTDVVLMGRLGNTRRFIGYRKQDRNVVYKVLEQLEVEKLQNRAIGTLSGGQLQRVMIARALACEPKLLLLDEPTANIDIHAEKDVLDILNEINREVTIVIVSHDIGFVSRYIKKVACLNKTLLCHRTTELTPELIQQLYGVSVRAVRHRREK
ncbi:MAG: ABC transporter [Coxiella sp. DG_40]|nr:MAG: ABC transporter [Coxiella sp. DG_40]